MKSIHTITIALIMLANLSFFAEEKDITCTVPPVPGSITGPPEACFSFITTYSIAPVSGATSYSWSVIGGSIQGSNGGTSIKVRFGHGGRSVSVRAVNSCGSSASRTKTVEVVGCLQ
jgi:large repetitive protein